MTGGTFKVSRRIWSHPDFAPSPYSEREAFLWIVSEASWKARRVRAGRITVDLDRGQLCASIRFMAEAWIWSKSKVDRYLKRLERLDMIRTESGTGQLVLTVCNYDEYQGDRDTSGTVAGHERDSSGTNYKKDERRMKEGEDISLALSAPEEAPLSQAVSIYNEAASAVGWPKVQKLTPARSQALKARLRECGGIEGWRFAMDKGKASDFLCGRTEKPWTGCGFDWITKQGNFTKLMEGNYDNRTNNGPTDTDATSRAIAIAARIRRTPGEDCF